nr:Chain A, Hypoxanthine-guanine Phosphoribosyltransferase [Toxoplasma gondii RH]1FSG_C Chain C, Hypoxanthine-guanine Phosphoribosyltransferase [Toxoplasma gondii RH]1QK3_A Chain A, HYPOXANTHINE-GUANINE PHOSPHORIBOSYLTRANSFERASE [Toxoplasma gondii RH]1QK3_B Chain B, HYPOXANTHINE-GUANINE PHOSPHORIBOSYLTRANSFERASE [Toxoplasma gondii RH]1QK3_C Chain C, HYPOXANTHINE-GUANINE PHOSPHORIBOSYLTRANSFERASE [Toxoplasma gondii RH]1QK3_D Chain D, HYPOXANTHINE-GUANINE PHOSPHORIBOSYLTRANSFERASE [Toxoplasma go
GSHMASKPIEDYGKGKGRIEPMYIPDNTFYNADDFLVPPHCKPYIDKILLPGGLVKDRVEKLAYDIHRTYFGEELHIICILKGSRGFFNLLIDYLATIQKYSGRESSVPPFFEHYVRLKSYQNDNSTGQLTVLSDDLSIFRDKHVLIVEDIVDTGFTLTEFGERLKAVGPKSMRIATLVEKRTDRSNSLKGDFVGFSIEDVWIVGCCYDFNEMFRDFDHVAVLSDAARKKFEK